MTLAFRGGRIIGAVGLRKPRQVDSPLPDSVSPLVTGFEHLALLIRLLPLTRSWQGSASLVTWSPSPARLISPVSLRVVGEETVTVPAGTYECWKIEYKERNWDDVRLWVSKEKQWMVKMRFRFHAPSPDFVREAVLTRWDPGD